MSKGVQNYFQQLKKVLPVHLISLGILLLGYVFWQEFSLTSW